jgi:hypothetical protein
MWELGMLSFLSIVVALIGTSVLFFAPVPRARLVRISQQGLGAVLFGAGLSGFIILLF